jgi:hypothetical protein
MKIAPFAVAGVFGLSLALATGASAMQQNRLLFVNGTTGAYVTAGINEIGRYVAESSGTAAAQLPGVTSLTAVPGMVLGYKAAGGGTEIFDASGNVNFSGLPGLSSSWQMIVAVGGVIFFYNGAHVGAAVRFLANGTTSQFFSSSSFAVWPIVTATDNYLFFYNGSNGLIATATVDEGGFTQTQSNTIDTGYTMVASINDDLLLYDNVSGSWESGQILYAGKAHTDHYLRRAIGTGDIGTGDTRFVANNGHLLLYNTTTGSAAIGHFTPAGKFIVDSRPLLTKFFTDLMNCGTYMALYGYGTGTLQTAYIDNAGNFHAVQTLTLATSMIVSATKN